MDSFLQDLRYSARSLVKSRGLVLPAILCLALGLGTNAALFGLVNGVLLKPLPYAEPDRIVRVFETAPRNPDELRSTALPTIADWNRDLRSLEPVASYSPWTFDVTGGDRPEQLLGASVSRELFSVLRVHPSIGRVFTAEEDRPRGPRAIILGHDLWQRRFGGDSAIVGRPLILDGEQFTVIGVMPRGFAFPVTAELWASTAVDHEFDARAARHVSVLGRLRSNATIEIASAELTRLEQRLAERFPRNYTDYGIRLIPLHERMVGNVRPALLTLFGAVSFVLLIACANVANLLLARASTRRTEMAVRAALGATRARIVRQLVLESLMLSLVGGVAGTVVATGMLGVLRALGPESIPRLADVSVDTTVLLFTFVVALVTGLVFGLTPALAASRADTQSMLREDGRGSTASRSRQRVRGALVVAELALALVLLVGAGLLIRSLNALTAVDPGVRVENVLTFNIGLPPSKFEDRPFIVDFYRQLRERLAAAPGVTSVALASRLPLSGDDHSARVRLPSEPDAPGSGRQVQDRAITPEYFRTLGIPLRAGREFTDADAASAPPVVIINEALARRLFPNESALGKRIIPSRAGNVPREVVGVVGDARQFGVDVPAEPEFYIPHTQDPWPWMNVVVRTAGDPVSFARTAESVVWSMDRTIPLTRVQTMEDLFATSIAPRRFNMIVLGTFACVALLLAVVGIYGVMASLVAQRTREIGIRVALGAGRSHVVGLIVGHAAVLAAIGVAIGLGAAFALSRLMRGLVFGVGPADPLTFAATGVILATVALAASYAPARRAMRVDPVIALRNE
jgi:putative ABC transport system permease protein